ncbi:MAG TPA: hypothetical protein VGG27_18995 [Magnetospirillaceae bacterium]
MAKANLLSRSEEARNNAAAQFTKTKQAEAAAWRERTKAHEADTEKMLRLRALRLEKEAADKVAAAAEPKPVTRAKRARVVKADQQEDI